MVFHQVECEGQVVVVVVVKVKVVVVVTFGPGRDERRLKRLV